MIDYVEMMSHLLSDLHEEYYNIVEKLEENFDDNIDMLTIKRIWDKLSANYNIMNVWSNQNKGK